MSASRQIVTAASNACGLLSNSIVCEARSKTTILGSPCAFRRNQRSVASLRIMRSRPASSSVQRADRPPSGIRTNRRSKRAEQSRNRPVTCVSFRSSFAMNACPASFSVNSTGSESGIANIASPLLLNGRLFVVKKGGISSCFDATTGKALWYLKRIRNLGHYYASPVAGDGKIYVTGENGFVVVLADAPEFRILAKNDLGESCVATPAIADGRIFYRTRGKLYCFENQKHTRTSELDK